MAGFFSQSPDPLDIHRVVDAQQFLSRYSAALLQIREHVIRHANDLICPRVKMTVKPPPNPWMFAAIGEMCTHGNLFNQQPCAGWHESLAQSRSYIKLREARNDNMRPKFPDQPNQSQATVAYAARLEVVDSKIVWQLREVGACGLHQSEMKIEAGAIHVAQKQDHGPLCPAASQRWQDEQNPLALGFHLRHRGRALTLTDMFFGQRNSRKEKSIDWVSDAPHARPRTRRFLR